MIVPTVFLLAIVTGAGSLAASYRASERCTLETLAQQTLHTEVKGHVDELIRIALAYATICLNGLYKRLDAACFRIEWIFNNASGPIPLFPFQVHLVTKSRG